MRHLPVTDIIQVGQGPGATWCWKVTLFFCQGPVLKFFSQGKCLVTSTHAWKSAGLEILCWNHTLPGNWICTSGLRTSVRLKHRSKSATNFSIYQDCKHHKTEYIYKCDRIFYMQLSIPYDWDGVGGYIFPTLMLLFIWCQLRHHGQLYMSKSVV